MCPRNTFRTPRREGSIHPALACPPAFRFHVHNVRCNQTTVVGEDRQVATSRNHVLGGRYSSPVSRFSQAEWSGTKSVFL